MHVQLLIIVVASIVGYLLYVWSRNTTVRDYAEVKLTDDELKTLKSRFRPIPWGWRDELMAMKKNDPIIEIHEPKSQFSQ